VSARSRGGSVGCRGEGGVVQGVGTDELYSFPSQGDKKISARCVRAVD
jgi:hypothetical protein